MRCHRSPLRRVSRARPSAFTLVEILTALVIVGFLMTIAMPSFLRARETTRAKSCAQNLKKIQWAKDAYVMDNHLSESVVPTESDLYGPDKYIKQAPVCPSGGTYTINSLSVDPNCSVGGAHSTSGG